MLRVGLFLPAARRLSRDRTVAYDTGVLALAVIAMIATACASPRPIYDAALFEYVGRELANGSMLYRDVWDNKLPSIFLVNALWSQLFGDRTIARALAECVVDLASVALFARLMVLERVRAWAPAAATFGIALAMLGYANLTEHYALPFILAGLLCARLRRDVAAGVCIAIAASFWIPAVLVIAVTLAGDRPQRFRAPVAACAAALAGAAAFVAVIGVPLASELVQSWTAYLGGGESLGARFADLRGVAAPLSLIVATSAAGVVLAWRAWPERAARRALVWLIAAWAGAVIPLHPFVHYLLPAVPAAIACIAIGLPRLGVRQAAAAAAFVALFGGAYIAHAHRGADTENARAARAGALIREHLGPGATLATDDYEPALYLASGARLRDRFELAYHANAAFVAARKKMPVTAMLAGYDGAADAYVAMNGPVPFTASERGEVCAAQAAPWHIYVRPASMSHFARCP